MELSDKEELFCEEYMIDLNQTRAYQRVFGTGNYASAATQASQLFKKVNIQARVKELMDQRKEAVLADAYFVVQNLIRIAQKCQEPEPVLEWNADTKQMEETGEYTFDSNGANKALELLGKHMGMFKDKVEHSGEVGITPIIIQGQKFADKDEKAE